ncbi:hypothetical protein B0J12DRAFT_706288 [Macrophomina phaseolina]|uniref:Uncharacterized protein n=1 Tax=Macrophomina phaseolina TaxID=35725 RepID=A0ABQ8FPG2_9PEZI|nr:hypothetical protein B0J12DRAFT_706288 [Macrophomina phaseolina]
MHFLTLLTSAGIAAGAAVAAPQITDARQPAAMRKRADVIDSAYLSSASSLCAQDHWDCLSADDRPAARPDRRPTRPAPSWPTRPTAASPPPRRARRATAKRLLTRTAVSSRAPGTAASRS